MVLDMSGGAIDWAGGNDSDVDMLDAPMTRSRKRMATVATSDTATLASLRLPPPDPKSNEGKVDQALRHMYRDIDAIYQKVGHQWRTFAYKNPFDECPTYLAKTQRRYEDADIFLGTEYIVVAMHSKSFRAALKDSSDQAWNLLLTRINANKESLRMFAILRRIPYVRNYENRKFPKLRVGELELDLLHEYATRGFPSTVEGPDEMYLGMRDGEIHEALICGESITTVVDPVYKPKIFLPERKKKPADWPERWPYPHNPTYAALSIDPPDPNFWPKCVLCKLKVVSSRTAKIMPEDERCTCTFADVVTAPKPLVEIREFNLIPNDKARVNRGIRALSDIKKGTWIGEYTGELIPIVDQAENDDYAFDFRPPTFLGKWGEQDGIGRTSIMTAQFIGNWVRFVNQSGDQISDNNCEFTQKTIAGRMRIMMRARENIRFGDELTCFYGLPYFSDKVDEQPYAKKRAKTAA